MALYEIGVAGAHEGFLSESGVEASDRTSGCAPSTFQLGTFGWSSDVGVRRCPCIRMGIEGWSGELSALFEGLRTRGVSGPACLTREERLLTELLRRCSTATAVAAMSLTDENVDDNFLKLRCTRPSCTLAFARCVRRDEKWRNWCRNFSTRRACLRRASRCTCWIASEDRCISIEST